MLGFIIVMLVMWSVFGSDESSRRGLRAVFSAIAIFYGIRILFGVGFVFLPLIIIIWALSNVVIPFVGGFISSFRKDR